MYCALPRFFTSSRWYLTSWRGRNTWTGMDTPLPLALIFWNSLRRRRGIRSGRNILLTRATIITSTEFRLRNSRTSRLSRGGKCGRSWRKWWTSPMNTARKPWCFWETTGSGRSLLWRNSRKWVWTLSWGAWGTAPLCAWSAISRE